MDIYDAINDPYCYSNSNVLINKGGLLDLEKLEIFEKRATEIRFKENLPEGDFSVEYYKKLHFHLFQDVYEWAGKFRTVRISKGGSMFCYPEHIENEMIKIFNNLQNARLDIHKEKAFFIKTVCNFLSELNAIHPFREGNGRTQMTYILLLATALNISFDIHKINTDSFLFAMIQSFNGKEDFLKRELESIFV